MALSTFWCLLSHKSKVIFRINNEIMGFFKQNLLFSNCFLFSIQDSNSPDYEPDDDNEDDVPLVGQRVQKDKDTDDENEDSNPEISYEDDDDVSEVGH